MEQLRIWDLESGRQIVRLGEARNRYESVDFSPDGRLLAVGSNLLGSVTVWNLEHNTVTDRWVSYDKTAPWGEFSPDSNIIVST